MMNVLMNVLDFIIAGLEGWKDYATDFANMAANSPNQMRDLLACGGILIGCFAALALVKEIRNRKLVKKLTELQGNKTN